MEGITIDYNRSDRPSANPTERLHGDTKGLGHSALDHHLLDLGDRLGGVEALGAGLRAVHDGVATVELERVLEIIEPFFGRLVAAVDEPAIGLQQHGRAEIFLAIPPIARARGRAAGAKDTLIEPVELFAIGLGL